MGKLRKLLLLSNVSAYNPRGFCLSVMDKVSVPCPFQILGGLVQFTLAEHLGKAFLKSAKYLLVFA